MSVREDRVRLPNGLELDDFHVVEYPDWACVLCITSNEEIVLVEQYRHGIGRSSIELPAGAVDDGEDPLVGARRELLEETGYQAHDWKYLGKCAPNPGKQTSFAHLFVASEAKRIADQELDPTESIRIHLVDCADVLKMAADGRIAHGIHLAAIFWAAHEGLLPIGV